MDLLTPPSKPLKLTIVLLSLFLILVSAVISFPISVKGQSQPQSYPTDPMTNIPWSSGFSGVGDVQAAFNAARAAENAQLGTSIPMLSFPCQAVWDGMTENEKAAWLLNWERVDREVYPMDGWEPNVVNVAQDYAQYLMDNNAFSHNADGKDPWTRLNESPAINACHDFLGVAENLAVFWTSEDSDPLVLERAVYMWMYEDAGSSWGHRHMLLWNAYNDNGGTDGVEGFLGLGHSSGPHNGWNLGNILVLNVFDPCAEWDYPTYVYIPIVVK